MDLVLVFPHQLFAQHPALYTKKPLVLIEEWLFFRQFNFHKQKLLFHRASMQFYKNWLIENGSTHLFVADPAYDWVMVPNVYGMTQFADGGLMTTKPYISGSNYLLKIGDWPKGKWQEIWDALFWRFMHVHRNFFTKNPRLSMLVNTFDKMTAEKKQNLLHTAEKHLATLDAAKQ